MLKNILVPLTGFENDANALEAAFTVGRPSGAAIEALHVQPEPMEIVLNAALHQFATRKSNRELLLALQAETLARTGKAKQAFDLFAMRHLSAAQNGVGGTFHEIEGSPVRDITQAARFSDLVVLARAAEDAQFSTDAIGNILVGCGRPVMLVPDGVLDSIGSTIAIAWKETAEAARSVTAAMPLLAHAKKVLVLAMAEDGADVAVRTQSAERLATQLLRHGMNVEAHGLAAQPHAGPHTLFGKAKELGVTLIVAGAYSHSRMRELVFGGFTRAALTACDLPVMLMH